MFGLNNAQLIGRLGADATVSHLTNGGRVANVSIATDESYLDKNSGDKVDRTEWHRIVTFQDGLVEMMEKHAKKGRLVYVSGKLQTRKWRKDGEDSDRFSTEILLVPGGRVQFLDKPNGNGALRRWRIHSPDAAHARARGARVTAAQQRRYVAPCRRCRKRSVRVGLDSAAGSGTEPTAGGTDGNVGTGAERSAGVLRRSARTSGDATARRGAASRWTAKPAPARREVLR